MISLFTRHPGRPPGRLPPLGILILAVSTPLLAMIPTWLGYHFEEPPARVFTGFRYLVADHFQYASFARQASDGSGLFTHNLFTGEPQKGVFLLLYFWIVGFTSRVAGGDFLFWWNAFKVLGGFLYVLLFWRLTANWFTEPRQRAIATGLFALGGGLNWIVSALRIAGLAHTDQIERPFAAFWNWSTFGTLQLPNWVWPALVFLLATQIALAKGRGRSLLTFVLLPLIWFLHPYTGMVAYLTFGLLPIVPFVLTPFRRPWSAREMLHENFRIASPALLSFGLVVAYLQWARTDSVFSRNSEQGFEWTDSYTLWWYPLCYGLILPLAFFGLRAVRREASLRVHIVVAWLIAAVLLSINPFYAGTKFQYLVFPPLVLLAAQGWFDLEQSTPIVKRITSSRLGVAMLALALGLNSAAVLVNDVAAAGKDRSAYMSQAEIAALQWLDRRPPGVVLSSFEVGNRIPALTGNPVHAGHWFMTPDLGPRFDDLRVFFSPQASIADQQAILDRSRARYVFFEPGMMGAVPDELPLSRVYSSGGYSIYEVRRP